MWRSPQYNSGKRGWPRIYRLLSQFASSILVAFLGVQSCPVRADITSIEGVISATEAKASVVLGDSVKVPLVGVLPGNFKPFEFGIIEQPEFGVLSKIVADPTNTSRAWVVYTPKPGAEEGMDSFRYNAKLPGSGKEASPSEKVTISLRNPVAKLRVEPRLAFGKVEVGKTKSLPLRMSNEGTKQYSAVLQVPAPWSIPEAQRELVLEPGTEAVVDVLFAPKDVKPATFFLNLQPGNPDGSIEIIGEGSAPFDLQVGTLDLDWDEATGSRQGVLRVVNQTDRELPLKLTAPAAVVVDRLVVIPPRESLNLTVALSGIQAFSGKLLVESQHFQNSLPLRAEATPAHIKVLKPVEARRFDFELLDTETPPVYEVVVMNTGGKSAFIYAETSRPFFVKAGRDPTEVASGKQMNLSVSMDPREVGSFDRTLSILGTANTVTFDLAAVITRNVDRTAVGVNLPNLAPMISARELKLYGMLANKRTRAYGETAQKRVTIEDLPVVKDIYLEHQGARKLVFSWDHPGPPDLDYVIEVEVYEKTEAGIPRVVWYQADEHVVVEKDDKVATMTLTKLVPGRQFRFRILTVNKDGHTSGPSRSELVFTLPAKKLKLWMLLPFVAVVGGSGFYIWRRRQVG